MKFKCANTPGWHLFVEVNTQVHITYVHRCTSAHRHTATIYVVDKHQLTAHRFHDSFHRSHCFPHYIQSLQIYTHGVMNENKSN